MGKKRVPLREGQTWQTRDGSLVKIESIDNHDRWPVNIVREDGDDGYSVTLKGREEWDDNKSNGDLMKLISEPPLALSPELQPTLVPPPAATQHSHYFIPVPAGLTQLDVYRLCLLAGVTDPCAQHILKKVLRPGQRGAKTERQDWENIRDTAVRRLAMMDEDQAGVV